jgi:hypothetical protein
VREQLAVLVARPAELDGEQGVHLGTHQRARSFPGLLEREPGPQGAAGIRRPSGRAAPRSSGTHGAIVGYTTGVAFFGHSVASSNPGLAALIGAAAEFGGPGFLLPAGNGELLRWALGRGLRVVQVMTLMSLGLYQQPRGAFLSSILF